MITNSKESSYFSISQIPNKGRGLVSNTQIPAKTVILTEAPLIKIPNGGMRNFKLNNLNYKNQELFMQLHHQTESNSKTELALDKYRTNAIRMYNHSAVFFTVSFINHSCDSNAYWYPDDGKMKVMTLKCIDVSTEITCDYIGHYDTFLSVKERRNKLKKIWNFDCNCNSCMLDEKIREKQDKAMKTLKELRFDVVDFLVLQLFKYNHNRWEDVLTNTRKQIICIQKHFNSDITALWHVYWMFLIATMKIGTDEEKREAIKKYNKLFGNIHFKWNENRTMLFLIFLFDEFINFSSPYIRRWKEKMKKEFHYLFDKSYLMKFDRCSRLTYLNSL